MLKPYWSAKSLSRQHLHAPRESCRIGLLFRHTWRTVVAWRFLWRGESCTTPISKEERHVSERFLCHTLVQCGVPVWPVAEYIKGGARTGTLWDKTNCFTVNENWKRRHSLKLALDSGLWTLARKVCAARLVMVFEGLYGTTNDPKNGQQMILDRKWSQKESKIWMAWTQVTGSSCHVYYHNKKY